MFHFTRSKKAIFTVAMATALCLVLSVFLPLTHSQTSNNFTLPCTINTTGNAWNGDIAFDLSNGTNYYLVVMSTDGTMLNVRESTTGYGPAYNIAPDTLMFEGEPQVSSPSPDYPTWATNFWNLTSNTTESFPNVLSEHDIEYDPVNNTFLTLQEYLRQVGNDSIVMDKIIQVNSTGSILWSWDTYNYIPLTEASSFNETALYNGQTVEDFTHSNSLDWDYNNSIIYLNLRNTNTFYKINQTSGNIIWACGEFGNFTLLGSNGQPIVGASLWYGEHDVKEVAPDVFTIFNNDYDNITNPEDCHTSLMEVTLNETSMTAQVDWSWEAPTAYWNSYAGGTLLLPNGDLMGDFGDPTHQFQQNSENGADLVWNFINTGAVFVEVNPSGQVVRTWTFPVGWYVYRIEDITNPTSGVFPTPSPTPVITPTPSPIITPTPVITSTPSVSPSSKPYVSINSQEITDIIILVVVILAVLVLAAVFYTRRRISKHKIGDNKKNA